VDNRGDPLVGRVLDGRYRIGRRIARGGMAVVHEAVDLRLDRTVAVKIMHAGFVDDPDFVRRFEREARTAARLSHHNAVGVFDQGEDGDTLFLVMEYVPGQTLRDVIRSQAPMSPARALALIDPVLSALNAAHRAGMIHRDVKPENVLITTPERGEPEVKVADFGLARAVNAETNATATGGLLIGTVSYLAPELVVDGHADARADVYAVGVVLYEMLTGRKPHQADSPIQVAYKHVHEDVPAPSKVVPGLPAYVDALVARATARDLSTRPADAGVLLHHVRRVRQALDQGVVDEPELTEDLTPIRREHTDELPEFVTIAGGAGELPELIIDPSAPDAGAAIERAWQSEARAGEPAGAVELAPRAQPAPRRTERALLAPGRPGRRGPLMLAALIVVIALLAVAGWYFGIARYTVTPGVVDLSSSVAQARLDKAGLKMRVAGQEYSETVPKDAVVRSDPSAGNRIVKHGTVSVVLSLGPERHKVPAVAGMSLAQAQAAIDNAHLSVGQTLGSYSEKVPQNQVIRTNPAAGTEQRRDTAITIVMSKGRRPITIPDFTGKHAALAERKLTKLGFTVDASSQEYSDTVAQGDVISQSPNSGVGHKGDTINLVVSKGLPLVEIPDVRRESFDAAKSRLEAMGLRVKRVESMFYIGLDTVAGISPAPGQMVRKGTVVTLELV
jgi:serine/threonine-protein kinase